MSQPPRSARDGEIAIRRAEDKCSLCGTKHAPFSEPWVREYVPRYVPPPTPQGYCGRLSIAVSPPDGVQPVGGTLVLVHSAGALNGRHWLYRFALNDGGAMVGAERTRVAALEQASDLTQQLEAAS